MEHNRPREFWRGEPRTFDVEMSVNQTGGEIRAAHINDLASAIIAQAEDASVRDRHVGLVNLAAENIDDAGVLEAQFGGSFPSRNAELLRNITLG